MEQILQTFFKKGHSYIHILQKLFQNPEHNFLQRKIVTLTYQYSQKFFYRKWGTKVGCKFMNTIFYKSMLQIHEHNFSQKFLMESEVQKYAPNSCTQFLTKKGVLC